MAANIQTAGLSGLAPALVQHDRLRDLKAGRHTHAADSAGLDVIGRSIACRRNGTLEAIDLAAMAVSPGSRSYGFPPESGVSRMIMRAENAIAEQAHVEGDVRALRQAGLLKVEQGLTPLRDVMAVTNE